MTCFTPLEGYAALGGGLTFKKSASNGNKLSVPCGQCIGCRLRKAQEWGARCTHEASQHDENIFITLTYDDEHLPGDLGLHHIHFQKFIRSLRKRTKLKIRYFMCGEYGDELGRPHYHALLFGYRPADEKFYKKDNLGNKLFTSDFLEKVWGKGFCPYGQVTVQSAAYVARYTTKKINGKQAESVNDQGMKYYERLSTDGEIIPIQPEYAKMSLNPGIGKKWYDQFKAEVVQDEIMFRNETTGVCKSVPTPNYYLKLLQKEDPTSYQKIKDARLQSLKNTSMNNTPERLAVREKCQQAKNRQLKRQLL